MNKLKALIYKVQPYGENGKLLFCYSRLGKVTLIARGSQKLNSDLRVLSQYLTEIEFEYQTFKTMMPLNKAKIINDFTSLKGNYYFIKEASLILDLINRVYIDNIYHDKVYDLAITALNSKYISEASLSFALKLTYYLGYGLELKGDGRKVIGLSLLKGGVVYQDEDYFIDYNFEDTLLLFKLTYGNLTNIEKLDENKIKVFKDFIYNYYSSRVDINLKALK
ncbi:MAG TPA: DNA repair protein RecO [Haploplasma sp.]|nr:DNA repair protein RecO [Haploplasma sp.]